MPPELLRIFEALAAKGIELVPIQSPPNGNSSLDRHFVFFRAGYAALVERRDTGFGRVGTAGIVTEHGLAMLVDSEAGNGQAAFVIRDHRQLAEPGEIDELRQFQADLVQAIGGTAE
jgi:hypothetical protein